jgi:hypothetical protein
MIEVRRMWEPHGPWRRWSEKPQSNFIPHDRGGYVGGYVCASCQQTTSGVYFVGKTLPEGKPAWLCGGCKDDQKPKQAQPEGLRKHRERQARRKRA